MKTHQHVLIIDHFDSFTYNLVQYFEELGCEVMVMRTDRPFEQMKELRPTHLVLSPGPGHPRDVPLFRQALDQFAGKLPILGVCLGHQAIAEYHGAAVIHNFRQMHGKTSAIRHSQLGIFKGLPNPLTVCRYHSLVMRKEDTARCSLQIIAETWDDGEIMAIASMSYRNMVGVQFHPESIFTEGGKKILQNFLQMK
jgi:anthranilate synthase/aminodeoxychorismate synthase-like glutamine amidotransferase